MSAIKRLIQYGGIGVCKVLIVDDEKMIRNGMQRGIPWESIGVKEVYVAASALEAIQIIEKYRPEIMITDINMTEMTGLDLIQYVRKINNEMCIIVITGYDRFEYAHQCLKMGVQNFLLKPIDEIELMDTIKKQVENLKAAHLKEEMENNIKRTEGTKKQMFVEEIMRKLICHSLDTKEYVLRLCEEFHFHHCQKLRAVVLLPELYIDQDPIEESFRMLTIKNICIDTIDAKNEGITFSDEEGRIVIAFLENIDYHDTQKKVTQLIQILENQYAVKPHVVIGSVVESFEWFYTSYNDALYLIKQEGLEFEEIAKTSKALGREERFKYIFTEFKKVLQNSIGDGAYCLHIFECFCQAARFYNLSFIQLRQCCFELASSVYYTYIIETGNTVEGKLNTLIDSISTSGKDEVCEVTKMFFQQMLAAEEVENNEIIVRAKHYIDENLDKNLTVSNIAETFYLSPNYFSRLFKRVMGEGCNEYVVRRRIEKSKSLLESTNMKAGKIAMMVGYNDTNYFSSAFKKHTGMSPIKYRENMRK